MGGLRQSCDLQKHPFFHGVDWDHLYTARSPFVPKVEHELDTQNFEDYDEDVAKSAPTGVNRRRTDPNFIGYTFKNFEAVHPDGSQSLLANLVRKWEG